MFHTHDDVIIFRVPDPLCGEYSPHKGQRRGALVFSLICAWISAWVYNREVGDFRRIRAHYVIIVMCQHTFTTKPRGEIGVRRTNLESILINPNVRLTKCLLSNPNEYGKVQHNKNNRCICHPNRSRTNQRASYLDPILVTWYDNNATMHVVQYSIFLPCVKINVHILR